MIIRRVRIVSLAKVLGLIYACIGLVAGALFSLFSVFAAASSWSFGHGLGATWGPVLLGAGAVIALPIFYGILGTIVGLLVGLVYNVIAGTVGGLEIDLEESP